MRRPSCLSFVFCLVLFFAAAASAQQGSLNFTGDVFATRVWTDASSTFKVEAQLLKVVNGVAHLKRVDNSKTIEIPLAKLCAADNEYIRKFAEPVAGGPQSAFPTAAKLEVAAKRQRDAKKALALYSVFMADAKIPDEEKERAKAGHESWQRAADQSLLRLGTKWLTKAEIEKLEAEELKLFHEATQLYQIGSVEAAEKRFRDASRAQPESIRADFRLGLLAAIIDRDTNKAADRFEACVTRRLNKREELTVAETANLCASLNNLAITEIRQRQYSQALGHWAQALDLTPTVPEIVQNLGRVGLLSRAEMRAKMGPLLSVNLDTAETKRWETLYTKARRVNGGYEFDPKTGWLYMNDVREVKPAATLEQFPPTSPNSSTSPTSSVTRYQDPYRKLRVAGSGTGFVIAPGYVMTNAHVADEADGLYLVEQENPQKRMPATVHVVSKRPDLDLAILRCNELQAPPLSFATELPRLGAELRLLGFPRSFELGNTLKVTRGLVSGLPPHSGMEGALANFRNYLLYDAVMNGGNSGGPACDIHGRVVAVNTAILLPYSVGGGYPAGVGSDQAVAFLQDNLRGIRDNWHDAVAKERTWEEAVEHVAASTVQVLILKDTNTVEFTDKYEATRRRKTWDGFEDPWCMACHGSGMFPCPVRDCKQGRTLTYRTESVPLLDGSRLTKQVPVRVPCSTCDGAGKVRCTACYQGIDPAFSRY
ncbi:trypsin-like peptidase domain-containing protein [Anatilimnocola floriformis]|uniref:trypsin-like peptidase domain-containing protein n=1 Tax=Anatilimnocola floriformis TaxID=2948575 RepID=UPI0020C1C648|nr:trypsin-like peptidase domain-containing protein [Anatilimnocola floriformis]